MKQLDLTDEKSLKIQREQDLDHKLTCVIEWCQNEAPDWFDDSFIHSLYIQHFESLRDLSDRQIASLDNIIAKFNIEI